MENCSFQYKLVFSAPRETIPAETAVEIVTLHEWGICDHRRSLRFVYLDVQCTVFYK